MDTRLPSTPCGSDNDLPPSPVADPAVNSAVQDLVTMSRDILKENVQLQMLLTQYAEGILENTLRRAGEFSHTQKPLSSERYRAPLLPQPSTIKWNLDVDLYQPQYRHPSSKENDGIIPQQQHRCPTSSKQSNPHQRTSMISSVFEWFRKRKTPQIDIPSYLHDR